MFNPSVCQQRSIINGLVHFAIVKIRISNEDKDETGLLAENLVSRPGI